MCQSVSFTRPFVISVYCVNLSMSQLQIFDTTLKVKNTTRDRLAKLGTKAHTYDLIIVELLDAVEELAGDQS